MVHDGAQWSSVELGGARWRPLMADGGRWTRGWRAAGFHGAPGMRAERHCVPPDDHPTMGIERPGHAGSFVGGLGPQSSRSQERRARRSSIEKLGYPNSVGWLSGRGVATDF